MLLDKKLARLKKILTKMDSVLVAFSGGVDSTFLLKVSRTVLPKEKILAVTANSPTYPEEELVLAQKIARHLDTRQEIIQTQELKNKSFMANTLQRCYFCKKELFQKLKKLAARHKLNYVVDASNLSDRKDFRPGERAKKELKIRSPLQEAGLTKEDIRRLSRKLHLATWDKPSLACLASRIAYGIEISPLILSRVARAEEFLRELGFKEFRVRHYNSLCRIEVTPGDIPKLMAKRKLVARRFQQLGYHYVTLDLSGYRMGSMNPASLK